ncbi:MAG: ABC transporter substrate-binding protein [Desulfuromusa sp.]|nr:ABC transporter substrate-binding protein [Desulfuromusa sp.]
MQTGVDLKGKRVGVNRETSSHFYLGVYLIHNNMSISDVEMVHTKTVDLPAALKNNEIDAISVWQPYTQEAERLLQGNVIILPQPEIYRTTFDLAVMKSFAKDHPEILVKLLRAINKADVFIKDNKEKAQEIIAETFKLDKDIVLAAWNDFVFDLSLDQSLLVSWDEIARWAIKNKLTDIKELPNYLNFIYMDALDAVNSESITIIR